MKGIISVKLENMSVTVFQLLSTYNLSWFYPFDFPCIFKTSAS